MLNFQELISQIEEPLVYIPLVVVLVAFIHQIYFYLRYICRACKATTVSVSKTAAEHDYPPVSVVVCARNERENLNDYLSVLLSQDYPSYEVIVVDDSSEDGTDLLLEQWSRQYAHLYHTFVPRGARVLSSKKLALTIGIKAAHHEHILLTDADCRPESRNWIREMMSGFANEKTEIVLGFSPYFEKKGMLNRIICYDTLFNGLQYMGMALSGHPYMGVGRNMAYKRNTFFETGGFKGLLSNRAGDDDLFVNRVATKHNTAVVCNVDSLVWSLPKTSWTEWLHQKRRHLSVSPLYRTGSKLRIGIEPLSRGLLYAGILASLIIGNMVAIAGVLALYLLRLLLQLILINIANKRLGMRAIGLGIVIFDIILPILTCYILITQPLQKKPLYW